MIMEKKKKAALRPPFLFVPQSFLISGCLGSAFFFCIFFFGIFEDLLFEGLEEKGQASFFFF